MSEKLTFLSVSDIDGHHQKNKKRRKEDKIAHFSVLMHRSYVVYSSTVANKVHYIKDLLILFIYNIVSPTSIPATICKEIRRVFFSFLGLVLTCLNLNFWAQSSIPILEGRLG